MSPCICICSVYQLKLRLYYRYELRFVWYWWSVGMRCRVTILPSFVNQPNHYDDVIMTMLASQITRSVVYSIVYSGVNQRKHQSSASLAFVWEIHRGPVNFPHKWPVTRKMFPFDDVIMWILASTASILVKADVFNTSAITFSFQ